MESTWIRPVLIPGARVLLIALNVIEFRGKRRRDAQAMATIAASDKPELMLAYRQYMQTQNIELSSADWPRDQNGAGWVRGGFPHSKRNTSPRRRSPKCWSSTAPTRARMTA